MKTFWELVNFGGAAGASVFWAWSAFVRVPDLMETSLSGPNSITSIVCARR
jgi:hypothetical protein